MTSMQWHIDLYHVLLVIIPYLINTRPYLSQIISIDVMTYKM